MTAFIQAFRSWKEAPFPDDGPSEELGELHADLALVDSWVAESLVPYVKNHTYKPAKVDVFAKLDEIQARAEGIEHDRYGEFRELAHSYYIYANLLRIAYTAFVKEQGE